LEGLGFGMGISGGADDDGIDGCGCSSLPLAKTKMATTPAMRINVNTPRVTQKRRSIVVWSS